MALAQFRALVEPIPRAVACSCTFIPVLTQEREKAKQALDAARQRTGELTLSLRGHTWIVWKGMSTRPKSALRGLEY